MAAARGPKAGMCPFNLQSSPALGISRGNSHMRVGTVWLQSELGSFRWRF